MIKKRLTEEFRGFLFHQIRPSASDLIQKIWKLVGVNRDCLIREIIERIWPRRNTPHHLWDLLPSTDNYTAFRCLWLSPWRFWRPAKSCRPCQALRKNFRTDFLFFSSRSLTYWIIACSQSSRYSLWKYRWSSISWYFLYLLSVQQIDLLFRLLNKNLRNELFQNYRCDSLRSWLKTSSPAG